jgi:hypothetical protein
MRELPELADKQGVIPLAETQRKPGAALYSGDKNILIRYPRDANEVWL